MRPERLITLETVLLVVAALAASVLVKLFLFQVFYIPSESMEHTLNKNDRVLVSVFTQHNIQRGDVVVFKDPGGWLHDTQPVPGGSAGWVRKAFAAVGLAPDPSVGFLVKRVIGLPGDQVKCCSADGRLSINGQPIDEPYVYAGNKPSLITFDVTVPEGAYWVMGDHRANSEDSRYHQDGNLKGMVPAKDIVGQARLRIWPLTRFALLKRHSYEV